MKLTAFCYVGKNQIDKTIKFLTVESPSPITRIGSKWQATAGATSYQVDQAYVNAITRIRRAEQQQMRDYLASLVGQLLEYGYEVWLTADHGNIQCDGKGRPSEGVIAETRDERVRVYPTPELRSQVAGALPFAHEWEPIGLPPDYFPLVAGAHDAFVNLGDTIVGHGGVAIEEDIVPLVKFERRTATVDFFGFALVCHGRIANLTYFLCNHEVKVWESRQEKLEKTGVITLDVLDPQRYILCFGFRIIRC